MPTYCGGCSNPVPLDPATDTVVDVLTRDTAVKCPKCGWRSDEPTTRGQLGPELELEAA